MIHKLDNGIIIYVDRFIKQPAFNLTLDGYGGSIMDNILGISGISHLAEHLSFKEHLLNIYVNAITTSTSMSFLFDPIKKKENDNLIKYIKRFFFKNGDTTKIDLQLKLNNLENTINEITNEYIYRLSLSNNIETSIFLNNGGNLFDFCGNSILMKSSENTIKKLNEFNNISPNIITIFLNKLCLNNKEIDSIISMFSELKENKIKQFEAPIFPYIGKYILCDIDFYEITFRIKRSLLDILKFSISIPFMYTTSSKLMNDCILHFVFLNNNHLSDFYYLLSNKLYNEILLAAKNSSYNMINRDYLKFYLFDSLNLIDIDVNTAHNNFKDIIIDILNELSNNIYEKKYVIFSPKDSNNYTHQTKLKEEYIISEFDLNNYVYLNTFPLEINNIFNGYNNKMINYELKCNINNIYEPNINDSISYFNKYSTSIFYHSLFLYYFTTPNINQLSFDRSNIPNFIKIITNSLETINEENMNIEFNNKKYIIKTNQNFFNIIFKVKSEKLDEFNKALYFLSDCLKHKGLLYFIALKKRTFNNYTYFSLYSLINDYNNIDIIINNIENEFLSLFEDKILIISKKDKCLEFPEMLKNISIKF